MVERQPAGNKIDIELCQTVFRFLLQKLIDPEHQVIFIGNRCFIGPEKGFQLPDLLVLIIDFIGKVYISVCYKLIILGPVHPARHRAFEYKCSFDHIRSGVCSAGLAETCADIQRPLPHVIGNKIIELMRTGHGVDLSHLLHAITGPPKPDLIIPRLHRAVLNEELGRLLIINNDCDPV